MAESSIVQGQAVIFSVQFSNGDTGFKYRLSNNEEGDLSPSLLAMLDIDQYSLPTTVDVNKLLKVIDRTSVTASQLALAVANKADLNTLKSAIASRVTKQVFSEVFGKTVKLDEFIAAMAGKANLQDMVSVLNTKASLANVYSKAEIHELLLEFIGAASVPDIPTRDSLDHGMYPFVWVHNTSMDPNPEVKSPALYKWENTAWVYLGTVFDFGGGGSSVDLSDYYTKSDIDSLIANLTSALAALESSTNAKIDSEQQQRETADSAIITRITGLEESVNTNNAAINNRVDIEIANREVAINAVNERIDGLDLTPDLTPLETRVTAIESELGLSNQTVSNILKTEFDREV